MVQFIENWGIVIGLFVFGICAAALLGMVLHVIRHAAPKSPLVRDSTYARIGCWADRVEQRFPGVTIAIWHADGMVTAHALAPEAYRMDKPADGVVSFSGQEVASARWHVNGEIRSVHLVNKESVPDDWAK